MMLKIWRSAGGSGAESGLKSVEAEPAIRDLLNRPQLIPIFLGGWLFGDPTWKHSCCHFPGSSLPVRIGLAGSHQRPPLPCRSLANIRSMVWYMPVAAVPAILAWPMAVGFQSGGHFIQEVTRRSGVHPLGAVITMLPILLDRLGCAVGFLVS